MAHAQRDPATSVEVFRRVSSTIDTSRTHVAFGEARVAPCHKDVSAARS